MQLTTVTTTSNATGHLAPPPDRNGRSVRGPAFDLTSVSNSKNCLDTVGPLVTWIDVYNDFSVHAASLLPPLRG